MAGEGFCCGPGVDDALDAGSAESLAATFAALGDPVRLRIYSIIAAKGEVCSCDLEAPVGRSQPTISHHTAKLAAAGLIEGERRGRWVWWRSVPQKSAHLAGAVAALAGDPGSLP